MDKNIKQELSELMLNLKRQTDSLLNKDENWHSIEIDIVKDSLRKIYDLVGMNSLGDINYEISDEEPVVIVESDILDQEIEEILEQTEKEFILNFNANQVEKETGLTKNPKSDNSTNERSPEEYPLKPEPILNPELDVEQKTEEVIQEKPKAIAPKTVEKTLGEIITKNPIDSLKRHIGINDKFQFINELFDGKMKIYNESLAELEQLTSLKEAMLKADEYGKLYSWDIESKAYQQFVTYLERRFS